MKSVSTALAAVALGVMVTMSVTPPAEAGPLRDALKKHVRDARFVGAHLRRSREMRSGSHLAQAPRSQLCALERLRKRKPALIKGRLLMILVPPLGG